MNGDLNRLRKICDVLSDTSLNNLKTLKLREARIRAEIRRLRAEAAQGVVETDSSVSLSSQSTNLANWCLWVENQIAGYNASLAALLPEIELAETEARKNFGRRETVRKLQARQKAQKQRLALSAHEISQQF